jgi:hypothetical protein
VDARFENSGTAQAQPMVKMPEYQQKPYRYALAMIDPFTHIARSLKPLLYRDRYDVE